MLRIANLKSPVLSVVNVIPVSYITTITPVIATQTPNQLITGVVRTIDLDLGPESGHQNARIECPDNITPLLGRQTQIAEPLQTMRPELVH